MGTVILPRRRTWLLFGLLTMSCSSGRADTIFTSALDTLCRESLVGGGATEVVTVTTDVIHLVALWQQYSGQELTFDQVKVLTASEQELSRTFRPEPIALPGNGPCAWRAKSSREPYNESILVELSFLVPEGVAANPTPGLFARISYGGRQGAEFYWLPISNGRIGKPIQLPVDDA